MTRTTTTRRTVGVLLALTVALGAVAVPVAAVSGASVTGLTNATAESGETTSHTLTVEIDDLSADGNTDEVFVELPNAYAGNASFDTASFVNATGNETVPISSSTTVVDGPDQDGVNETLRTGLSHDANYSADDVNGTYQFDLTHPTVMSERTYNVTLHVNDSDGSSVNVTEGGAITVQPADMNGTPTDTDDRDDGTDTDDGNDGTDDDESSGNTPGFTAAIALLAMAVLAGGAYLRR